MEINTGMQEQDRKAIAIGLSNLLADSYMLFLKTHNYHWNVTGPMFNSLHTMFEEQYTELFTAVDEIAERIRALGEVSPGTFAEFAELTELTEKQSPMPAEDMIRDLVIGQETVVRTARRLLDAANNAGDEPTVDLLTQRMQLHEKNAWMLRSLLE